MIDSCDEFNEWGDTRTVKRARKSHKCTECGRQIQAGESYRVHTWIYDGQFDSSKSCAHCMVAEDWLTENCSGYLIHGVWEDINEHCQEYQGRAKCIARLARIKIGMERDWQIRRGPRKGQLMPVPQLPAKLEPNLHH